MRQCANLFPTRSDFGKFGALFQSWFPKPRCALALRSQGLYGLPAQERAQCAIRAVSNTPRLPGSGRDDVIGWKCLEIQQETSLPPGRRVFSQDRVNRVNLGPQNVGPQNLGPRNKMGVGIAAGPHCRRCWHSRLPAPERTCVLPPFLVLRAPAFQRGFLQPASPSGFSRKRDHPSRISFGSAASAIPDRMGLSVTGAVAARVALPPSLPLRAWFLDPSRAPLPSA